MSHTFSAPAPLELASLPVELLFKVLLSLRADGLARASRVCRAWQGLVVTAARERLLALRGPAAAGTTPHGPSLLCSLSAAEDLTRRIGRRADGNGKQPWRGQTWRDEWVKIRREELVLQGNELEDIVVETTETTLPRFRQEVEWLVQSGWEGCDAKAYTLLVYMGRGALGAALRVGSRRYAASTHALTGLLLSRAGQGELPPTCFCNLSGRWGLSEEDPAWGALSAAGAAPGASFIATTVSGGLVANDHTFADGRGLRIPIFCAHGVEYQLQDAAVVAFVSRPPSREGWHALVQTTPTGFSLPPLARVTLVSVLEAGEWAANGHRVCQRCYTVSVSYA
mmetsp:Transcript_10533/g.30544  ORF Transcript_10533/g.30544 Transcript_10533/m.30544 type:complete len:339 (+) Transcript_10533:48-1064(+)